VGGGHARGVWLTHGQWHMGVGPSSKGSQKCGSQADHSLYIKQMGEYLLIVIIYVDDFIILASNGNILKWLKSRLENEFEMSDLGELHYCLGVEFERDRANHTITMSQSKYIEEVLKRFNMEECKPIGTPLDVNSKLLKLTKEEFQGIQEEMQGIPYKAAVGSLMYAMVGTRPDLAFPVSMVDIHVKGWSFPLDGGETHHAVLEGHFGIEIVPWRQGC
jgi:hypothetical protein